MTSPILQDHLSECDKPGPDGAASVTADADIDVINGPTGHHAVAAPGQPHQHIQALPEAHAAGPAESQDAVVPDVIPLDFSDVPSDEEAFIAQKAVLGAQGQPSVTGESKETDLLQRIWRAGKDMGHPYAEILGAKNPLYVKTRIKELIATLENISLLMEELDRYRQGVIGELIHQYGLADCPVLWRKRPKTESLPAPKLGA